MQPTPETVTPQATPVVPVGVPAPVASPPAPPSEPIKKPLPIKKIIIAGGILLVLFIASLLVSKLFVTSRGPEKVELTWWGLWEDTNLVGPLISEYQQKNPNVTITYVKQSKEDYRERLTNAIAKGTGPDIFRFHNSWLPLFKNNLEPAPVSVVNSSEFSADYYPDVSRTFIGDKGVLGIPLGFDSLGLYVNEEIFETYGKTVPTTWDALRQTALDLTIKDEDGNIKQSGVALGRTENIDHWQEILALMMLQNNVQMTNLTGDQAKGALQFYTIFNTTDKVWDETLPSSTVAFANNKVAMYFGPSWRAFEIKELNPKLRFRVVPVPQLPKDSPNEPDITYASYWVEGVSKTSKNATAAWHFLKFLSEDSNLQKLYTNEAATRLFGEPYPKVKLGQLLSTDPVIGGLTGQFKNAQSWYLYSRTFDGATGINSRMSQYFTDAVNGTIKGNNITEVLTTLDSGVKQVLAAYGLISLPKTSTQ